MNRQRSAASFALALLTSLAATAVLCDPAAPQSQAAPSTSQAAETPREVEVESLADTTICRRERPTGSKIAVKRCYTRSQADTRQQSVANAIMRQDIEALRQQQVYYEQARLAQQIALQQQALQRAQR
jgi:hypothetical protein